MQLHCPFCGAIADFNKLLGKENQQYRCLYCKKPFVVLTEDIGETEPKKTVFTTPDSETFLH